MKNEKDFKDFLENTCKLKSDDYLIVRVNEGWKGYRKIAVVVSQDNKPVMIDTEQDYWKHIDSKVLLNKFGRYIKHDVPSILKPTEPEPEIITI